MHSVRRHLLLGAAAAITVVFAALASFYTCRSVIGWWPSSTGIARAGRIAEGGNRVPSRKGTNRFRREQPAQFARGAHAQYFELWIPAAGHQVSIAGSRELTFVARVPGQPTLSSPRSGRKRRPADRDGIRASAGVGGGRSRAPQPPARPPLALVVAATRFNCPQRSPVALAARGCMRRGAGPLPDPAGWIIRRGLRPVDAIAARIERVGKGSLPIAWN